MNTSALFINAFPRDDTIPQKVCAKLGSGGDRNGAGWARQLLPQIEAPAESGNSPSKIFIET